ncbi:unnamed protein product [Vitrella brassicaformis CCMP3155]|uniref:CULT domain-containing protein n=1 Tax=Vitrella brassicaformis (strain CCMP3155) TaxID=1169540 RepID=A0A0G4H2X2_VITBC|nr:unnamed protein product [Vitrella brassicaformis CCMP3155]|mmetsp:Transcript_874/g.2306  ORF Transcript_874/g.2306 Transcript_874/m.2306 type:complete len:259 (+) Transcript_874:294-1070(+)|eukprot:CEM37909.1 unnamed protein product [Vitrella brassicaformis CCMP3155]
MAVFLAAWRLAGVSAAARTLQTADGVFLSTFTSLSRREFHGLARKLFQHKRRCCSEFLSLMAVHLHAGIIRTQEALHPIEGALRDMRHAFFYALDNALERIANGAAHCDVCDDNISTVDTFDSDGLRRDLAKEKSARSMVSTGGLWHVWSIAHVTRTNGWPHSGDDDAPTVFCESVKFCWVICRTCKRLFGLAYVIQDSRGNEYLEVNKRSTVTRMFGANELPPSNVEFVIQTLQCPRKDGGETHDSYMTFHIEDADE